MEKEGPMKIKSYYKEAFRCINDALRFDEQGEKRQALQLYQKGLRSLITGLSIKVNGTGTEQEKAREMQEKMKVAKKEVQERIEVLSSQKDSVATSSRETAMANGLNHEVAVRSASPRASWEDVQELMVLENGVKMFFVSEQGNVTTFSQPQTLYAFQFVNWEPDSQRSPAFLQCAAWMFPMIPGRSPVLNTEPHTYMFPDITIDPTKPAPARPAAPKAFASVGLILNPTITDQDKSRFERILKCYTDFHHYTPLPQDIGEVTVSESERRETVGPHVGDASAAYVAQPETLEPALSKTIAVRPRMEEEEEEGRNEEGWSGKVTRGIAIGAELIAWGLFKGAEVGTQYMHKGSEKLRKNLKPNEVPKEVDPKVQDNIRHVKNVTGMACQVSGALVSAVGALTVELGRKLAPMIADQGGKVLPETIKKKHDEEGKSAMDDVVKVAVSGVKGFATVFIGLEQSWKLLYKNLQHCTVQTVDHKYGSQVAGATNDAMGAAGYALQTYWNIDNLGVKAIAKRAAKDTGKELVYEAGKRLELPDKPHNPNK